MVGRRAVVATDADLGLEPDGGVGIFDDCAIDQAQPRARPVQTTKIHDLAQIDDLAEVHDALRYALAEDLKSPD